jgi:hypothetical protein
VLLGADFATLLIPVWIVLFLLALVLVLGLLGRVAGGKYLRPIITTMAKVPLLRKGLQKLSTAAMERSNPELASAMKKMERSGALRDPQRAQVAMSQLTAGERKALMEMQQEQGLAPQASNRAMRRRMKGGGPQQQRRR